MFRGCTSTTSDTRISDDAISTALLKLKLKKKKKITFIWAHKVTSIQQTNFTPI